MWMLAVTQPVATIIGAVIVGTATLASVVVAAWGVKRTIRSSAQSVERTIESTERRQREAYLVDRAKERDKWMREHYGEFSAAAFDLLVLKTQTLQVQDIWEKIGTPPDAAARYLRDKYDALLSATQGRDAEFSGALARLVLVDDDPKRIERSKFIHGSVSEFDGKAKRRRIEIDHEIQKFIAETGESLDDDFRRAVDLATKGEYPTIRVRPKPASAGFSGKDPVVDVTGQSEKK